MHKETFEVPSLSKIDLLFKISYNTKIMLAERLMTQLHFDEPVHCNHIVNGIRWSRDEEFDYLAAHQEPYKRGSNNSSILPSLAPLIFRDNPKQLLETISSCSKGDISKVEQLDAKLLQLGKKAHILLFRALCGQEATYFVTYLSRTDMIQPGGLEAESDYRNLKDLAARFKDQVPPKIRDKFDVVEPITKGQVQYQDKLYPFFTMPFLPYGELSLRLFDQTPFFGYALDHGEFGVENTRQLDNARRLAKAKEDLALPLPDKRALALPYHRQLMDVLVANSLVYIVSGGHFPAEHAINAGDWMGLIQESGLLLRLITIRGGWRNIHNDQTFIETLRKHREVAFTQEPTARYVYPFGRITKDRVSMVLEDIRSALS